MPNTVPNQRVVTVHREPAKSNFLGIKNENWQYAARDLGAHALMLYLYLASNANGYTLALSPAAIREATGMPRSTYQDQVLKLIDKGYLIQTTGNGFDFYEVPKPRHGIVLNELPIDSLSNETCTNAGTGIDLRGQPVMGEDIEINNRDIPNKTGINIRDGLEITEEIKIPKVREIIIQPPTAEPKKKILRKPEEEKFVF